MNIYFSFCKAKARRLTVTVWTGGWGYRGQLYVDHTVCRLEISPEKSSRHWFKQFDSFFKVLTRCFWQELIAINFMFLFRPPFPTPKNYFVNFKRRKTEVLKTLNWTFEVLTGDIRDCLIFENELISKSFRSKLKTCKKPFNYDLRNLICFLEVGIQLINRLKNSGMQNWDFSRWNA